MKPGQRRQGAQRMWRAKDFETIDIIEGEAYVEVESGAQVSLGAKLSELLAEETPEDLLKRVKSFKRSVEDALARSSSAFQILRQLETSGLKDCARCTRELEDRLAKNPHYQVLNKLAEAEELVRALGAGGR